MAFILPAGGEGSTIHDAIRNGDLARVEAILGQNPDEVHRMTTSYNAGGDRFFDSDPPPVHSIAPIHLAVWRNHLPMVAFLLRRGARVDEQNDDEQTPLHMTSDFPIAMLLLEHGAPINAQDRKGHTPLWHAAWRGNRRIALELRRRGAWVDFESAVRLALVNDARAMLHHCPELATRIFEDDRSALMLAVKSGSIRMVRLLVQYGADPAAKEQSEQLWPLPWSILQSAITGSDYDIAEFLLEPVIDLFAEIR